MEILLSAKSISKTFQGRKVLDNINIEIKESEIVAISGASGAGKTTLLNILSTLDKPDVSNNPSLFINDLDVFNLNNNDLSVLRNQMIGFVFQFHELIPELNILENVCLPGWIKKDNEVEDKAKDLLKYFGLIDFLHKKTSTLSGGEKQRVAIARSLINEPKIIFADEPTGNLDSKNSKILFDLFFKLRDDYNCSVVIVTHNESNANICDRKLLIVDGKIKS
ncbi:MAG: ABC transporter ATP-binding protein [Cryomorphaceae bacterium]|jgi:lipoprotein-releasing system ATP-binding protein|nr:ABC transporter ATP-binding protein [Cryomorphaceae bacterium]MBT7383780.1 ABC transporter ATP-binding protein [Cryomorphaceae bacterium]